MKTLRTKSKFKQETMNYFIVGILIHICCFVSARACEVSSSFTMNGFMFEITSYGEASVSRVGDCGMNGDTLHVPSKVTHDGTSYQVTKVKASALSDNRTRHIVIDEGIRIIEDCAFANCHSLESMHIPSSVDSIGVALFSGCDRLERIVVDERNPVFDSRNGCNAVIKAKGDQLLATCPATAIPSSVRSIEEYAFAGCQSLTDLHIPEGVETIKQYAFSYCENLESISFPSTLRNFGGLIFEGCPKLRNICIDENNPDYESGDRCNAIIEKNGMCLVVGCSGTIIPGNVRSIGKEAFAGCDNLERIDIPEGVECIGEDAFHGCLRLSHVSLPRSLREIDACAFSDCISLEAIRIPRNVARISTNIVLGCTSLRQIKVDARNKTYDSRHGCNAIVDTEHNRIIATSNTTTICDDIKEIGRLAFYNTMLTSICIPKSVERIHSEAFLGMKYCCSLRVDEGNKVYDSRQDCNAIIETATHTLCVGCCTTNIPSSVKRIGPNAFYKRILPWTINLPEGITHVEENAFFACEELRTIILPSSLQEVGISAFASCRSLNNIVCRGDMQYIRIGSLAFRGCPCEESVLRRVKRQGERGDEDPGQEG